MLDKKMSAKQKLLGVRVDPSLASLFEEKAKEEGKSVSNVLRGLIAEYLGESTDDLNVIALKEDFNNEIDGIKSDVKDLRDVIETKTSALLECPEEGCDYTTDNVVHLINHRMRGYENVMNDLSKEITILKKKISALEKDQNSGEEDEEKGLFSQRASDEEEWSVEELFKD